MGKPRIRVTRPWPGSFEMETESARFSTELAPDEADALVCAWAPTEDLLAFPGPSAWYTAEPRTNLRMGVLRHREQRRFLRILEPFQMLHHAHEDPRYRIPHVTHSRALVGEEGPRHRTRRAVALVSNYGGSVHNRWPDIRLRNDFVTAEGVDLFGRRDKWKYYSARWFSWPRAPRSFRGGVEEAVESRALDAHAGTGREYDGYQGKISLMAQYHTAVCLENTCEPFYFTEKFVHAVLAGCVPVYRAHPTVRDGVLEGAAWVDPGDFGLDSSRSLAHALSLDRGEVAGVNHRWLASDAVRATEMAAVWNRIAEALLTRRADPVDYG